MQTNVRRYLISALICLLSAKQLTAQQIRGKLVYKSCATIAVQVLDPGSYGLGQKNWRQAKGKPVLKNVFAVSNQCSFPNFKLGATFTFKVIDPDPKAGDCMTCMLFDNSPDKKVAIEVLKGKSKR